MQNITINPDTIVTLLRIPRREIAARCGVTCDWLRIIARALDMNDKYELPYLRLSLSATVR
jgi:hypothetical protein